MRGALGFALALFSSTGVLQFKAVSLFEHHLGWYMVLGVLVIWMIVPGVLVIWMINWIIHLRRYLAFIEPSNWSLHHCSSILVLCCAARFRISFMSSYVCLNPHCKGRHHCFVKEKSFGMHLQKSTSCWHFFRSRMSTSEQSGAKCDYLINGSVQIRSLAEDANALYLSSHCAVPLRCAFVHDDFLTSGCTAHPFDDANFPVSPHAPHQKCAMPSPPVLSQYSTDQKWTVALLKLLDDMNGPDYAFKAILTWACAAHAEGFSFQPGGGKTRRRNVERLFAMMNNATQLLPTVRTVAVPDGSSCDVIWFDCVPQLLKLLQNQTIMTQDNLLIDVHNPLLPYTSPDGVWGEALSGQVYQDAYKSLVTDPQCQLFVPIIQWIDCPLSLAMMDSR